MLRGHSGEGDVLEVATRHAAEVSLLREQVERQQAELERISADVAASLRHVAVVRFDAFGDMGGRLSFSAAVLDDAGDGLVLTSIDGRGETRSYAKGLVGGKAEHTMSPEEAQAVERGERGSGRQAVSEYGYLGPSGTFTEAALLQVIPRGRLRPADAERGRRAGRGTRW